MTLPSRFQKEWFLVLQLNPDGASGVALTLSPRRGIHLTHYWPELRRRTQLLSRLRPSRFLPSVVTMAEPTYVYTAAAALAISRERGPEPIERIEFENLLAQTFTRALNEKREEARRHLGVSALDAVLVGSRITRLAVDGRDVLNPIGLPARRITGWLELTFSPRTLFEGWRKFWSARRGFYFTDSVRAQGEAVARARGVPAPLVAVGKERSFLWRPAALVSGNTTSSSQPELLGWSLTNIYSRIAGAWGLPGSVAPAVYRAYLNGETSPPVRAAIERALKPVAPELVAELKARKLSGEIQLAAPIALPFPPLYPARSAASNGVNAKSQVQVQAVDPELLLTSLGFSLRNHTPEFSSRAAWPYLASFLEFYYDKSGTGINHWLKRRVHWLVPAANEHGLLGKLHPHS
ncbi:MAG: hypothetical protein HY978_00155 [Candidatus Liptonbacteria bacterium]|nr:hypothetical protein [Candidatus Liptonbacteria bacterium]